MDKEEILRKLDDYSKIFVDYGSTSKKKSGKVKKKRWTNVHNNVSAVSCPSTDTNICSNREHTRHKKAKKLKSHCDIEVSGDTCDRLTDTFSLEDSDFLKTEDIVKTKQSDAAPKKPIKKQIPVEVIEFHDPAKRGKKLAQPEGVSKVQSNIDEEKLGPKFDLESSRHEVKRIGINGLPTDLKDKATVDLLIKLGAKPKKNKYYNYKEYQKMQKQQKIDLRNQQEMERKLGQKVSNTIKARKRRNKDDVGVIDGQIGRYKAGVQHVKGTGFKTGNKHK